MAALLAEVVALASDLARLDSRVSALETEDAA